MDEQSRSELKTFLSVNGISMEDVDTLLGFVCTYAESSYARNCLQADWMKSTTKTHLYNYDEAITSYLEAPFEDLSCREAAFIVCSSAIDGSLSESVIQKGKSALFPDLAIIGLKKEQTWYDCYDALFCPFESSVPVSNAVVDHWKEQGITFAGKNVHLVAFFGRAEDGTVTNIHCGVLLEGENHTYLFEKIDPLMPCQLSLFESVEDIKTYYVNRPGEDGYKEKTVFVDYKMIK